MWFSHCRWRKVYLGLTLIFSCILTHILQCKDFIFLLFFHHIWKRFMIHFSTWIFWHWSSDLVKASYGQARQERKWETNRDTGSEITALGPLMCGSPLADKVFWECEQSSQIHCTDTPTLPLPCTPPAESNWLHEAGDWKVGSSQKCGIMQDFSPAQSRPGHWEEVWSLVLFLMAPADLSSPCIQVASVQHGGKERSTLFNTVIFLH